MKIYMAGPLFSTAEINFNAALVYELCLLGHEVFLPQEHEQRKDRPREIFLSDVRGIDWANAIVACLDGADPDSGTCWELGYAYARKKISVAYRTDFRLFEGSDPVNLMMTESVDHWFMINQGSVQALASQIHTYLEQYL